VAGPNRAATHTIRSEGTTTRHCSTIFALYRWHRKAAIDTTTTKRVQESPSLRANNLARSTVSHSRYTISHSPFDQKHRSVGCCSLTKIMRPGFVMIDMRYD
jgi:hypothetical protein